MKGIKEIAYLVLPTYFVLIFFSTLAALLIISDFVIPYTKFFLLCVALCLGVFAFNASNMVFDKKIDCINKPLRPVPSGRISEKCVLGLAAVLYLLSISIGWMLGINSFWVLFSFATVSLLYSVPPIKLKSQKYGSNLSGSFLYGAVPVLAAWSILDGAGFPIGFLLLFSGLTFGFVTSKDFEDMNGDSKCSVKTLPVMFGIDKSIKMSVGIVFGVLVVFLVFSVFDIFSRLYIVPALMSFILLLFPTKKVYDFVKINNFVKSNLGKDLITQSNIVTHSILTLVAIELSFGLWSFFV